MVFKYRARTASGELQSGFVAAKDWEAAVGWIRQQGCFPVDVRESSRFCPPFSNISSRGLLASFKKWSASQRISSFAIARLFRQLASLCLAGVPLAGALSVLESQAESRALARRVAELKDFVSSGVSFADSMRRIGAPFTLLAASLVASGERGGRLGESFSHVADLMDRQNAFRDKLFTAVAYPLFVLAVAVCVLCILLFFVVPTFARIFSSMRIPLPWVTHCVFEAAERFSRYAPFILGFPFLAAAFFKGASRFARFRQFKDRVVLRIPIGGALYRRLLLSRVFRTLALLFEAGVPLLDALDMSAATAQNKVFSDAFDAVRRGVAEGKSLATMIAQGNSSALFEPVVRGMVAVGEESGELAKMLGLIAEWYEAETQERLKRVVALAEPLLILFVGGVVAAIAAAVFVPIISVTGNLL